MTHHDVTVAERNVKAFVAVRRYRAECQYKWNGEWRRSRDDAIADGEFHVAWAKEDEAA
jgi:hypothetical protein